MAWLAIGYSIWTVAHELGDSYITSDMRSALPVRVVEKLIVNIVNDERTVANNKCEFEGVQDIYDLVMTSVFEEMWAYLPEASDNSCRWVEIGRDERSETEGAYVGVDRAFLAKIMAEHDQLHLYHFHPFTYLQKRTGKSTSAASSAPLGTNESSADDLMPNLRFAMPSPSDIHFMMDVTWQFHQFHPNDGSIRHRVVTPFGVIDYALTKAGIDRYASDKDSRYQGLYIKMVAGSTLADDNIDSIINKYPRDIKGALGALVQNLNTEYLRVTHTRLPKAH